MSTVLRWRQGDEKFKVILGYEFKGILGCTGLQSAPLVSCLVRRTEIGRHGDERMECQGGTCACSL